MVRFLRKPGVDSFATLRVLISYNQFKEDIKRVNFEASNKLKVSVTCTC